jgi:glycosyltransferase involved in cell wall biosynthesis
MTKTKMLSVVIPVLNERESLHATFSELIPVLESLGVRWEVVVVDDGSSDGSGDLLERIREKESRIKILTFSANFGKAAALAAGAVAASGDTIVTLDADGQDDPNEISRLLEALDSGLDCVSGWRVKRQDNIIRKLPSKIANWLIRTSTGVRLRDYGCGLKAYRAQFLRDLELIGEMHRMTPILVRNLGGRVGEIPVHHRPRVAGKSKYGLSRTPRVIADLLVARFFLISSTKPMYLFGKFALVFSSMGFFSLATSIGLKLSGSRDFVETPLVMLGLMSIMLGFMTFLMGILAEVIVRIYFREVGPPYRVRKSSGE